MPSAGQAVVDRLGHLVVGHGRIRGLHVDDQMGRRERASPVTALLPSSGRGGPQVSVTYTL